MENTANHIAKKHALCKATVLTFQTVFLAISHRKAFLMCRRRNPKNLDRSSRLTGPSDCQSPNSFRLSEKIHFYVWFCLIWISVLRIDLNARAGLDIVKKRSILRPKTMYSKHNWSSTKQRMSTKPCDLLYKHRAKSFNSNCLSANIQKMMGFASSSLLIYHPSSLQAVGNKKLLQIQLLIQSG